MKFFSINLIHTISGFSYKWQTLVGAFIGALTPVTFWFFVKWYQNRSQYKENLFYLEKIFVLHINNLNDIQTTLEQFIEGKLNPLIALIEERTAQGGYSTDRTFFPLFFTGLIDNDLLKINSKSGYLENKIVQSLKMSKDFVLSIEDIRNQFKDVIHQYNELAIRKINPFHLHNEAYKTAMEEFRRVLHDEIFGINIKIFMKQLIITRAAFNNIKSLGLIRWRFKFSATFKYFKNESEFKKFQNNSFERVDKYIKDIIISDKSEIGTLYKKYN